MPPLFVYRLNCLPLLFSLGLQQKNQQKKSFILIMIVRTVLILQ